jgi:hypothetical protein
MIKSFKRYKKLNESVNFQSKNLIVVDIQPAYEKNFGFKSYEFAEFINKEYDKFNSVLFLFNGPDLGFPDKNEYEQWLLEIGIESNIIDESYFFDKGYAFFRFPMDEGIDTDQIVNLLKFMKSNKINDSRDMTTEKWIEFIEKYGSKDIRELMEHSGDMINLPDLMNELKDINNIVLCGGGIDECLKEVEIALMVLDKDYEIYDEFTF